MPAAPGDDETARRSRVLQHFLNIVLAFVVVSGLLALPLAYAAKIPSLIVVVALLTIVVASRVLKRSGRLFAASVFALASIWLVFSAVTFLSGGIYSINVVFFIAIAVFAGVLLGRRATVIFAALGFLAVTIALLCELFQVPLPRPFPAPPISRWVEFGLAMFITVSTLNLSLRLLDEALHRSWREIEERKRVEAALRESETRYRLIANNVADIIWTADLNLRFTFISPSVERVRGYTVAEAMAQTPAEVLTPESLDQALKLFEAESKRKPIEPGRVISAEWLEYCKDGSLIWTENELSFLFDDQANLVGIIGLTRDITERKLAEEALRDSETRYKTLFDASRDAIMTIELPDWHLSTANQKTREMFRASSLEELTVLSPWDLSPPRQPDGRPSEEKAREMIDKAMTEGEVILEWQHRRLDGEDFPATVLLSRCILPGRTIVQATVRDVTEIKKAAEERARLEEQFRQSQKMEAIGRLAGGIAHDFNNILTGITGYAELLLSSLPADSPLVDELTEIRRAADRAASLTSQLLAFSRKQIIDPKIIDVNELLGQWGKMLQRLIGEDVELVFLPARELCRVRVDPSQLEQVLVNLTVNARDAMPDGGKLTIATDNVVIDSVRSYVLPGITGSKYVLLTVSDTGCGIEPKVIERMFEPFFTTKGMGKGTGLGLSTVYGIMQQNGGAIRVESEVGRGTTFHIYLPCAEEEAEALAVHLPSAPLPRGQEMVLVVEDEPMVRDLARRILVRQGYQVLTAGDGTEALALARANEWRIDLLLTDVVMPGVDGKRLFKELRKHCPYLEVLYMSGYTDDVIAHHGVLEPGTLFVQKPFTPEILLRHIRDALELAARRRADREANTGVPAS